MLDMLELQKNCGTIKVSFVLFNNFKIDNFRSTPHIGLLNRSPTNPDGSRDFPVFREDNTLSSSIIIQGGVAKLLADSSRTLNSCSCILSMSFNSGISGLALHCIYTHFHKYLLYPGHLSSPLPYNL